MSNVVPPVPDPVPIDPEPAPPDPLLGDLDGVPSDEGLAERPGEVLRG